MTNVASSSIHEPTTAGTIGATVAALIAFPFVFLILAGACTFIFAIVMVIFEVEFPPPDDIRAWARDIGPIYFKLGLSVLEAITSVVVLFLVFRIVRRADRKRAIVYFGVGMLVLTMLLILSGDFTAGWGLQGVVIACTVYYMRIRQLETMTPPE